MPRQPPCYSGVLAADLARFVETTAQISVPRDYRAKIVWALAILGAAMIAGALVVRFVRLQNFLSPRPWAILSCVSLSCHHQGPIPHPVSRSLS